MSTDDIIDLTPIQQAPEPEKRTWEPLEPGLYAITIVDAEHRLSSQKKTPGIHLKAEVASGSEKGRVVFDDWWLTPAAKGMLRDRLGAVGIDLDNPSGPFRPSDLIGRHAVVKLEIEEYVNGDGTTSRKNRVRFWNPDPERPNSSVPTPTPAQSSDVPF